MMTQARSIREKTLPRKSRCEYSDALAEFFEVRHVGWKDQRLRSGCPSGFKCPKDAIPDGKAWEILILAIEAADDALVGISNHSFEVGSNWITCSKKCWPCAHRN